jgi:hypothetical protein
MRRAFILVSLLFSVANAQESASDIATGASGIYARDTYRIDTLVCPFKDRIEYEAGEIECGLLQVPENREDPVIYLTGGTGGASPSRDMGGCSLWRRVTRDFRCCGRRQL